jgi:glycine dehydrogenase subunit 1
VTEAVEHRYLPLSAADRASMLATVGVSSEDELFAGVPPDLTGKVDLPQGMSEQELVDYFLELARENEDLTRFHSFIGAGAYRRFIPAAVVQVMSRPEFYTAYTPYQAEASQGWLQSIQSLIADLTGMDVANASMYEGATALAEAAVMALGATGRPKVTVAGALHPEYTQVLQTYGAGRGFEVNQVWRATEPDAIEKVAAGLADSGALIFQHPNFFGQLEDVDALCKLAHDAGALAIVVADPISLALLRPPADYGADIAVGECQQLGVPLWYGGPYCGYLATRQELLRKIPGRLVGAASDAAGRRGYVLTLQAREQHIRRESATSNICTNQALIALGATAYMAIMGSEGLRKVAEISVQRAHYLAERLGVIEGYERVFPGPFLWEFVLRCPRPAGEVLSMLRDKGVLGGVDLGPFQQELRNCILVAVTEMNSPRSLEAYVEALSP